MFSQNKFELNCGTVATTKSIELYKSLEPQLKALEQDFMLMKSSKARMSKNNINSIPIKAHIVRNLDGTGGLELTDLNKAIESLNEIYKNAFMNFFLYEKINYINNNQSQNITKGSEKSIIESNYVSGIINIYFIDYVKNELEESICGYTDKSEKINVIVMKNSCTTNDSSLSHEMGHFFSLTHTHGPSNSKQTTELVDGSNCDTDGDGICDTPADPKLSANTINNFCGYIGTETDAHGNTFNPDTRNIMSYSRKACRNKFSDQQFARMYAFYKSIESQITTPEMEQKVALNDDLTKVKIYPNPASNGSVYIQSSLKDSTLHYKISNFQGQILAKGIVSNKEINVNNLASGSYLLVLENSSSRVVNKFMR